MWLCLSNHTPYTCIPTPQALSKRTHLTPQTGTHHACTYYPLSYTHPLLPPQGPHTHRALYAHCLLSVYKYLMVKAMTYDLSFNIQPALVT